MLPQVKNKQIEAVLFDLDGTLLRAQMTEFIPRYVEGLAQYCAADVKPKRFIKAKLAAIRDLIQTEGDGRMTNEGRLFALMRHDLGISEDLLRNSLEHFEKNGLPQLQNLIRPIPLARQIVKECRQRDVPLVLATNPVFPRFMIRARMLWGGLEEDSFQHITSYENSRFCKPQAKYFAEVAETIGVRPENCLMVGNDLNHDLAAAAVGMQAFLVDTWLVERGAPKWPCDYRGDHQMLQDFLQNHLA